MTINKDEPLTLARDLLENWEKENQNPVFQKLHPTKGIKSGARYDTIRCNVPVLFTFRDGQFSHIDIEFRKKDGKRGTILLDCQEDCMDCPFEDSIKRLCKNQYQRDLWWMLSSAVGNTSANLYDVIPSRNIPQRKRKIRQLKIETPLPKFLDRIVEESKNV